MPRQHQTARLWVATVCGLTVLACLTLHTSVVAEHGGATLTATVATLPAVTGDGNHEYVGSKKCKKCHIKEYKSWEKTRMAKAFDILKPGNSKEAKEKFGIDVNKDFTTDPACIKCHTVGYGKPGGYTIPDPTDKKAVRDAQHFEGIGCESCHGPGGDYVEILEEIQKSKRTYRDEELIAAGMYKIGEAVCKTCHNEESPTIKAGDAFDYEKKKEEGTHEHFPLKQRQE